MLPNPAPHKYIQDIEDVKLPFYSPPFLYSRRSGFNPGINSVSSNSFFLYIKPTKQNQNQVGWAIHRDHKGLFSLKYVFLTQLLSFFKLTLGFISQFPVFSTSLFLWMEGTSNVSMYSWQPTDYSDCIKRLIQFHTADPKFCLCSTISFLYLASDGLWKLKHYQFPRKWDFLDVLAGN